MLPDGDGPSGKGMNLGGDPTLEDLKGAALQAGATFIGSSLIGPEDADGDDATALLNASLAWLRGEVRLAESADGDADAVWPREALRTLLVILEELQRLLPVAITCLVDDAIGSEAMETDSAERERAREELLSRRLLSAHELETVPREILIAVAVQRFREREPSGISDGIDKASN